MKNSTPRVRKKLKFISGRSSNKKTVGYGFVARWHDGTLGWALPEHLCGHPRRSGIEKPNRQSKKLARQ
jgi:hypothetical protein